MSELPDFEFDFGSAEYLTKDSWTWRWRQFFFMEVRRAAPDVLRELADLLPEWRESVKGADLGTWEQIIQRQGKNDRFCAHLMEWQTKYGLDRDQQGEYPDWIFSVAALTFDHWVRFTPNPDDIGKGFAPIGGEELAPLEKVTAFPEILTESGDILDAESPEESAKLSAINKQHLEELRSAVQGKTLILPPSGFDPWYPFWQTRKFYLAKAEVGVRKRIINDDVLSHAGDNCDGFVNTVLKPVREYCQKLSEQYEQAGYIKRPNSQIAERSIRWAVKVQVLGYSFTQVAKDENYPQPGVVQKVHEILKTLDLSLRNEISGPGRRRGSTNSPLSPSGILKK